MGTEKKQFPITSLCNFMVFKSLFKEAPELKPG